MCDKLDLKVSSTREMVTTRQAQACNKPVLKVPSSDRTAEVTAGSEEKQASCLKSLEGKPQARPDDAIRSKQRPLTCREHHTPTVSKSSLNLEAEARGLCESDGQPDLNIKFQDSQDFIEVPCLQKKKRQRSPGRS